MLERVIVAGLAKSTDMATWQSFRGLTFGGYRGNMDSAYNENAVIGGDYGTLADIGGGSYYSSQSGQIQKPVGN